MGKYENNTLVSATQARVRPKDQLPKLGPEESPISPDYRLPVDAPFDWERPTVPDWAKKSDQTSENITPDSIPTIEGNNTQPESWSLGQNGNLDTESKTDIFPSFDVWAFYLPFHFYRS